MSCYPYIILLFDLSVNLSDFFDREALLDRLKEEAQNVVELGIQEVLKLALRELGLPEVIKRI